MELVWFGLVMLGLSWISCSLACGQPGLLPLHIQIYPQVHQIST